MSATSTSGRRVEIPSTPRSISAPSEPTYSGCATSWWLTNEMSPAARAARCTARSVRAGCAHLGAESTELDHVRRCVDADVHVSRAVEARQQRAQRRNGGHAQILEVERDQRLWKCAEPGLDARDAESEAAEGMGGAICREPVAGVEGGELYVRPGLDRTRSVGGSVQRAVVERDRDAVRAEQDVHVDDVTACGDAVLVGVERVFEVEAIAAAVRDHQWAPDPERGRVGSRSRSHCRRVPANGTGWSSPARRERRDVLAEISDILVTPGEPPETVRP